MRRVAVQNFLGETIFNGLSFHLTIPLHEKMKITFGMQPDDNEPVVLKPFWGVGAKVSKEMKQSYYAAERYLIKLNNHALNVYGNQKKTRMASEIRYCRELANKRDSRAGMDTFRIKRGRQNAKYGNMDYSRQAGSKR